MGIPIAYLYLTLDHSKGQGQAHFDSEYLGNGDRCGKHYYCNQMESCVWAFEWQVYN